MRDGLRVGDCGADGLVGGLPCFGECIVSRVKVFALLREGIAANRDSVSLRGWNCQKIPIKTHFQLVAQDVLAIWQLAVQTEEFLLLF